MELLEPFEVRAKEGNGAEVGSATESVSGGVGSRGMVQGEVEFCEEGLPTSLSSGEVLFGRKWRVAMLSVNTVNGRWRR